MKYINIMIEKICNRIDRARNYSKITQIGKIGYNSQFQKGLKIIGGNSISIGNNFFAGPNCRFETYDTKKYPHDDYKLILGNNVRINSSCHIGALNKIVIGDDVLLGSHILIIDHSHGATNFRENLLDSPHDRQLESKGRITIGDKCWICDNVVILPNVTIGNNCIIAAGSVVTKDIPGFSIVAGNPASVIRQF